VEEKLRRRQHSGTSIYRYFISSRDVDVEYFSPMENVHQECCDDQEPMEMLHGEAERIGNPARAISFLKLLFNVFDT